MKVIGGTNAHALRCDEAGCDAVFWSYSMHTIIRRQAKRDGWGRRIRSGARADLCTAHNVRKRSKPQ